MLATGFSSANAEELDIGHLEATDDSGISWQYYACEASGGVMHCHIVQTLINHKIEPADRDGEIARKLQGVSPANFQHEMADFCPKSGPMQALMQQSLASGKKINGTAYTKQEAADIQASIGTMATACKSPTVANIRRMIEQEVDQMARTCVIWNIHSKDTFRWNELMQAWESRTPIKGPCGTVTETRLKHDPGAPQFWLSEERHMYTKRDGILPDGRSCSIFPADRTYHFRWQAATNAFECTYVKNRM